MAIEAAEKLRYLLERRYGRDAAQLDQILQATPMAITLSGHFHGQPAVFKRNLHPNARANVRALPDILAAYDTVMDEQSQVHPLLGSIPRLGISIFGHVEGVHPSDFFTTAEDTARDQVIRALDRWLGRSARLGSEPGILSPNWLLQRTQTRIDAMPDGTAKTLARRLFRLLDEFASLHHAHPIHLIVGHGDCHSGNFLWVEPNPDAPPPLPAPGGCAPSTLVANRCSLWPRCLGNSWQWARCVTRRICALASLPGISTFSQVRHCSAPVKPKLAYRFMWPQWC